MRGEELIVLLIVVVGLLFSLYYGLKAPTIFRADISALPASGKFHQFWLNFLGSVLGWVLLGFGLARVFQCVDGCSSPIGLWDAVLLFGGFVGVTGHLPVATVGLIQHFVRLVEKHARGGEQK